jgi:hypothetical protein
MLKRAGLWAASPPVMIGLLTLAPFGIYWSDTLSSQSLNLSRQVGFDVGALLFAIVCVAAFWVTYALLRTALSMPRPLTRALAAQPVVLVRRRQARRTAVLWVLFLAAIGVGVTVATVSVGGSGFIRELLGRLASGEPATDLLYGPEGFMFSERVSGVVRMFSSLSTSAVFVWLALWVSPWREFFGKSYWLVLALLLLANAGRAIIGGDRTPAVMAFAVVIFVFIVRPYPWRGAVGGRRRVLVGVAGLAVLVGVAFFAYRAMTNLRGADKFNNVLVYADLGVANLTLAMRTGRGLTYGLNTFLVPLPQLFRALGIPVTWPVFESEYIWAPPGNLLMFSFEDWGQFGFFNYVILGSTCAWVRAKEPLYRMSCVWRVAYLHMIYALAGVFSAPVFAGPLFWIGLFGSVAVARRLDGFSRVCGGVRTELQRTPPSARLS